jgi:hypothetical protein
VIGRFKALKKTDWKKIDRYVRDNPYMIAWVLLPTGLFFMFKWRVWEFSFRSRPPFPVTLYVSMLKRLGKYGIRKQANWTHREFLKHLSALSAEKYAIIETLTAFYEQSRFGNLAVTREEKNTMLKYLRQL